MGEIGGGGEGSGFTYLKKKKILNFKFKFISLKLASEDHSCHLCDHSPPSPPLQHPNKGEIYMFPSLFLIF